MDLIQGNVEFLGRRNRETETSSVSESDIEDRIRETVASIYHQCDGNNAQHFNQAPTPVKSRACAYVTLPSSSHRLSV